MTERLRTRARAQEGFTMIEVVVAALLATIIVGASLMVIDVSNGSALDSQRDTQATAVAQRELERVHAMAFDQVGLTAAPTASASTGVAAGGVHEENPGDPRFYVRTGGRFLAMRNHSDLSSGVLPGTPAAGELLVTGGSSVLAPTETFAPDAADPGDRVGSTTVEVHRFVTQRSEACVTVGGCTGDSKRVTVAVVVRDARRPLGSRSPTRPAWFSTVINRDTPSQQVADGAPLSLDLDVEIP